MLLLPYAMLCRRRRCFVADADGFDFSFADFFFFFAFDYAFRHFRFLLMITLPRFRHFLPFITFADTLFHISPPFAAMLLFC